MDAGKSIPMCAASEHFYELYTLHILYLQQLISPFDHHRNDGAEPDYMAVNPSEWLSSSMESCCKKFFSGYAYDSCMNRYPRDDGGCTPKLFYPDWEGGNEGCMDDGKCTFTVHVS